MKEFWSKFSEKRILRNSIVLIFIISPFLSINLECSSAVDILLIPGNLNYEFNEEPGESRIISLIDFFGNYSIPMFSTVSIESFIENQTGFFGEIVFSTKDPLSKAPINKTILQNITNRLLWKFKEISAWENYVKGYHNHTLKLISYQMSFDRFNHKFYLARQYPNNITENLIVDTKNGITTKILWHNSSLLPLNFKPNEEYCLPNSIRMTIIEFDEDKANNSVSLPFLTFFLMIVIPILFYSVSYIKKFR